MDYKKFLSRKFIAMIIGIICFIMTTLMPELDYQSLENIIYIIMAYIFAEAGIDAVAVHRKNGGK